MRGESLTFSGKLTPYCNRDIRLVLFTTNITLIKENYSLDYKQRYFQQLGIKC